MRLSTPFFMAGNFVVLAALASGSHRDAQVVPVLMMDTIPAWSVTERWGQRDRVGWVPDVELIAAVFGGRESVLRRGDARPAPIHRLSCVR
jgi:hypothetical protein